MKNRWIVAACAAVCWTASAQTTAPYAPAPENLQARTAFQDAKFGIFLHWGLYSMLGSGEWTMTNRNINYQEYAKLANAFYPHDFDAAEWVSAIKSSGQDTSVSRRATTTASRCGTPRRRITTSWTPRRINRIL